MFYSLGLHMVELGLCAYCIYQLKTNKDGVCNFPTNPFGTAAESQDTWAHPIQQPVFTCTLQWSMSKYGLPTNLLNKLKPKHIPDKTLRDSQTE